MEYIGNFPRVAVLPPFSSSLMAPSRSALGEKLAIYILPIDVSAAVHSVPGAMNAKSCQSCCFLHCWETDQQEFFYNSEPLLLGKIL